MTDTFSRSYAEARARFLAGAAAAGLEVASMRHPEKGRDGEELAMDVVHDGHPNAGRLLILTSGCHGVEGYCGSGVQVAALADREWREYAAARGVAVLYIHALNPYGFSHIRRTTHENVDLNRNFQDFSKPLPVNEGYRGLHELVLPQEWPPSEQVNQALGAYIAKNGEQALQAAVSRGQHEFPGGMFFGGTAPTWSNRTLREVLRTYAHRAARLGWIDFHTGLGPSGHGERIFAGRDDPAGVARARDWWKEVTSMCNAAYEECPQAEYTGIALEYGTLPQLEVLQSLRAEHWLHLHPEAPPELAQAIKMQMLAAFYTDTDEWRSAILAQAREAMFQAVDGLTR
jgi:hypothetical protein